MAGFNSMGAAPGPDAMAMTGPDMDAFNASMAFEESLL
jgi:hypothetical protein